MQICTRTDEQCFLPHISISDCQTWCAWTHRYILLCRHTDV